MYKLEDAAFSESFIHYTEDDDHDRFVGQFIFIWKKIKEERVFMICNEWNQVKKLLKIQDKKEVCNIWTEYCLQWFTKKAIINKRRFYLFSIVSIVCPLLNTIETVWFDYAEIAVILSSLTALSSALLALFNAREKWNNYRSAAEFIKNEYMLYQAYAAPYENEKCRDEIYLKTIGDFMQRTHKKWQTYFDQATDQEHKDRIEENKM